MPEATLSVQSFLEELVRLVDARLKRQEKDIASMRRELFFIRKEVEKLSKAGTQLDTSVIRVLRGE
jgi:hypothetical protein